MPNIRCLKKKERKTHKWPKEAMEQAMQEVQAGRLTARHAAYRFGVPKSTLSDRLSGRVTVGSVSDPKLILNPRDEASLVEYCLYSSSEGFPLIKSQVLALALAIHNYRNPGKSKTFLGQTWWINFRERHHHRLVIQTQDFTDYGAKREPVEDSTHPLVTSGRIPVDLAQVLSKTSQICKPGKLRRNTHVLMPRKMSDVIMEVEVSAAGMDTQNLTGGKTAQHRGAATTSDTLPGDSCLSRKRALEAPMSSSHSPSVLTSSKPSHMSLPSKDQHHQIGDASNCWQTSSTPPLSPGSSSSATAPTASTGDGNAKRQKRERKILRCGRCRQPYPPQDPEGLVLWVQCDNCHKMFHTICVSSEIDLDQDQFWCFWCLDD